MANQTTTIWPTKQLLPINLCFVNYYEDLLILQCFIYAVSSLSASSVTMLRAAVSDGNSFRKDSSKDLRDEWFQLYKGNLLLKIQI